MPDINYSLTEYINLIRMSRTTTTILVEGKDDKMAFNFILDELFNTTKDKKTIYVDTAQKIKGEQGNREKVEIICDKLGPTQSANKLVGFVDREYRHFCLGDIISDELDCHLVQNRLVWSRGHSIENYYFDFSSLRQVLRGCSNTDFFREALELFEKVFQSAIRLACAVSLTGKERSFPNQLLHSINSEVLWLNSETVCLKNPEWENKLVTKHGFPLSDVDDLLNKITNWLNKLLKTDFNIVRWLCHGHLGFKFLWETYSLCVQEVCKASGESIEKAQAEGQKVLQLREDNRFNNCASSWAEAIFKPTTTNCHYPKEVLSLANLI